MKRPNKRSGASTQADSAASSSVGRVFEVLDLFSAERPLLRIEDIGALLGYTRSTCYRYVKALADAGLVAQSGGGCYSLGPRAIELDRLLQITDPLLHAGQAEMPMLSEHDPACAFLLCTLYGDRVLCIHHEGPSVLEHKGRSVSISRPRGSAFPLFSGAASLAILANLPAYRIRSLYLKHQASIHESGLASEWSGFRSALGAIRRDGYAYSSGTFNVYLGGVAVPVLADDGAEVLGSLTQVASRDVFEPQGQAEAARLLSVAAARIAQRLPSARARAAKTEGSKASRQRNLHSTQHQRQRAAAGRSAAVRK